MSGFDCASAPATCVSPSAGDLFSRGVDNRIPPEVRRVSLHYDDKIIVSVDWHGTPQDIEKVRAEFRRYFPLNDVIVITKGMSLTIAGGPSAASGS